MDMSKRFNIVSVIFLLLSYISSSATEYFSYEFREVTDCVTGKSVFGARRVLQDSRGMLWVGTTNGLFRYDGYHVKSYSTSDIGVNSGFITSLCEDSRGNVWVGTSRGLCYYEFASDRFFAVDTHDDESPIGFVSSVICDPDGVMWIDDCRDRILSYYNGQLNTYSNDLLGVTKRLGYDLSGRIYAACVLNDLMLFDKSTGKLESLDLGTYSGCFNGDELLSPVSHPTSSDIIFVASVNDGLCLVDVENKSVRVIYKWMPGQRPYYMSRTKDNNLLVSTNHGVVVYDILNSKSRLITADSHNALSLPENDIKCSISDNNGNIWACTANNGLFSSQKGRLSAECHNRTDDGISLTGSMVSDFAQSDDGNIWVTTQTRGLLKYNPQTRSLVSLYFDFLPDYLNSVCVRGGQLYVGTSEGIWVINQNNGRSNFCRSNRVESLLVTPTGRILVGGVGGLFEYDREHGELIPLLSLGDQGTIVDMVNGQDDRVWCLTYSAGVYVYDLEEEKIVGQYFDDFGGIEDDVISTLCLDQNNEVWVTGRESSLYMFEDIQSGSDQSSKNYTLDVPMVKLMSANVDKGIAWLSTNSGLFALSLQDGTYSYYTERDGLLNDAFTKASMTCADGRLALGSRDGFIILDLAGKSNEAASQIKITDFFIHGKSAGYVIEEVLDKNIELTSRIELDYHDNNFGLSFSDIEHSGAKVYTQLHDYDPKPVELSSSSWSREFYGLRPGKYTLILSGHSPLEIIVHGPFLSSAWGITMMIVVVLVLMSIVGFVVYRRTNALRQAEIDKLEKARREEFLRNLETVVERHINDEAFNVDIMASDLFLSRSTLTRRMKNYINEAPNDFIRKKRMIMAAQMLEEGVLSITEISYKVGFSYPSYFTKCFKEHFGVTPSEFIKHD